MKAGQKNALKKLTDFLMTVVLLCLMACQVTGEVLHEWLGMGMTALLILHHVLNRRWYAALFRGRYTPFRVGSTLVNTLLLGSMALTAVCGMSMSAHAVPFLYGLLPVTFARQFHLALSFWSFLLMGLHLGLHIPVMTAGLQWGRGVKALLTALWVGIAGVGFWLFVKNGIQDYLFFRTPFAFFDESKSALRVFAEYLAMLLAFALPGAGFARLAGTRRRQKNDKISPSV